MDRSSTAFLVVAALCVELIVCSKWEGMANAEDKGVAELDQEMSKRDRTWQHTAQCRDFTHVPDALTINGDVMRQVGDGVSAELCLETCLQTTDFYCAAAQIRLPATCYITGHRLRSNYYSTHYKRVCDHGPHCFKPLNGFSAGFTNFIPVPKGFRSSPESQARFCMSKCEQLATCVGFDLKSGERRAVLPSCVFLDMGLLEESAGWDLYIRRC